METSMYYNEGWNAFRSGKKKKNPYIDNTKPYKAWEAGWEDCFWLHHMY